MLQNFEEQLFYRTPPVAAFDPSFNVFLVFSVSTLVSSSEETKEKLS